MAVFVIDGKEFSVEGKKREENKISASVNSKDVEIELIKDKDSLFVRKNGMLIPVFFAKDDKGTIFLHVNGTVFKVHKKTLEEAEGGFSSESRGEIEPPMPGKVLKIEVKEGDEVKENQVLLVMESMKLQVEIKAPFDGKVAELKVEEGQTVNAGETILKIEKNA